MSEDQQLTLNQVSESNSGPKAAHIENSAFGDIPADWSWEKTVEHLEYIESGISESQNKDGDGIPVSRIETIANGTVNYQKVGYVNGDKDYSKHRLKPGDLLFSNINSRDEIGKTAIYRGEQPLYHGMNLLRLRYDSNVFNPYFAYYIYDSPMAQDVFFRMSKAAVGQSSINQSQMERLFLPTPPLPEQRKIATVLYTVDRAIEKTEEVISRIESVLSGVIEELLIEGYGEKKLQQNRIYSFEFQMPTDWEVVELQSLNKESKPICYGIVQPGDYHEGGIPILNIEHSRYGDEIDTDELHRVSTQLHEKYSRSKLTGGEIVISVKGSTGDVGKVPSNIDEWNISRDLARISPNDGINRDWLRFYLSTELAQKFIHVNSPGSTRDSLNIGDLKQLPILLPPQDEQDQIADVVGDIEDKLDSENQYLNQLQRLKRGLVQDLLSGTVRTTDTNIEVPEEIAQYG